MLSPFFLYIFFLRILFDCYLVSVIGGGCAGIGTCNYLELE